MKRIVLALIVTVIGIFVVSSIAATHMLQNSHVFRKTTGNSSFCEKCHPEQVEGMAITEANGYHPITSCEFCHQKQGSEHAVGISVCEYCHYGELTQLQEPNSAHASMLDQHNATVACISCHTTHNSRVNATYRNETQWTMS